MTPAERVTRIKQLREQVQALVDEIARLESEDDGYVGYRQRAQGARRPPVDYENYARYSVALGQLEAAWASAGRPARWQQLTLLMRLRDVLLVGGEAAPAAAPLAASAQAPAPVRPAPQPAPTTAGAAAPSGIPPVARPAAAAVAPAPRAPSAAPAATVRVAPATAGTTQRPVASAAPASNAPTSGAASRRGPTAPPEPHYSQSQLAEMHSPILNEVGELTKRAEEEFRSSQLANGFASAERAVYLLERVAHAPAAMTSRLLKVLDDGLKEGSVMSDSDRVRREAVRERIQTVIAEES
jgi:hypothetical protein